MVVVAAAIANMLETGVVSDLNSEWRHIRGFNLDSYFNDTHATNFAGKKKQNRHEIKFEMNLPKSKLPTKGTKRNEYYLPSVCLFKFSFTYFSLT